MSTSTTSAPVAPLACASLLAELDVLEHGARDLTLELTEQERLPRSVARRRARQERQAVRQLVADDVRFVIAAPLEE